MTWDVGLANMFNANKDDRTGVLGTSVGEVISTEPLKISMSNGAIILDSTIHDIYICNQLLDTYTRSLESVGKISFADNNCGVTTPDGACQTAGNHTHNIESININTSYTFDGEVTFTNTLNNGDDVMLVPDESGQAFFIVDKVEKVGG